MRKEFSKVLKSTAVSIVAVLLLSSILMPLSTGCNNETSANTNPEEIIAMLEVDLIIVPELDAETELLIKQDWHAQFGYPLLYVDYYGTYNDHVVFVVSVRNNMVNNIVTHFKVAGVIFRFNVGATIYTWKDGVFVTMTDAYQQGLLTSHDIKNVGDYHRSSIRKERLGDDKSFNEWFFNEDDLATIIE